MKARAIQVKVDAIPKCTACGSLEISRHGRYYSQFDPYKATQKYICKHCGSLFAAGRDGHAFKSRFKDKVVLFALGRLRSGSTTRDAATETCKEFGVRVSRVTVWWWGRKYGVLRKTRDLRAGHKVQQVLLRRRVADISAQEVADLAHVNYNTVKTVLRRMNRPASKVRPEVIRREARITYLERRISEMREELMKLKETRA